MGFMMKAAGRMARGGSKRQRREREAQERRATCAKAENFELPMCVQMRAVTEARAAAHARHMAYVENCRNEPFALQCIGTSTETVGIIAIIVALLLCICCCRGNRRRHNHWD